MSEKKRKFKLFDSQREGKEILKSDVIQEPNLKKFWLILKENLMNRLFYVNLMMIIGNFPMIFILLAFLGVGQAEYFAPTGNLFSLIQGITVANGDTNPASLALMGITGVQLIQHANTTLTYIFYGIGALTLFTWGFVSAGTTYVLRNLAMGRPIFLFSDFFDTIRKNWKQALFFGMVDLAILLILPFNMFTMLQSGGMQAEGFFFWVSVVLFIAYIIMRWYVYLQIVTFDLPIFRIVSNSMKFILIGIKRNLLALLGTVLLTGLAIAFLLAFNGLLVVLAIGIPLFCLFSVTLFMGIYAAWYKIDEVMVLHPDRDSVH